MSNEDTNPTGLAERFARLWESTSPDLDTFLAAAPQCGASELADILRTDLTARWRAGQRVPAEDYIRRLGQESTHQETVVDLIYAEYLVREELLLNPQREEFYGRFPEQVDALRNQFARHSGGGEMPATYIWKAGDKPLHTSRSEVFPRPFGRYKLLRSLGQGGMGKVYLAQDEVLGRRVAIKVPRLRADGSPVIIARFLREAQAAAALNHPQLCPVYDVGQVDGVDYLTMPFITGGALSDQLRDKQPLPPDEAVAIVIKVANALDAAHQAGVVHRDLKPANILMNDAGDPVITDFGLAVRTENHDPPLTTEGGMLGTIAYMPPEQIAYNAAAVGPRSDVYSLGVIFYQLLTGRTPFIGEHHEILRKTLTEDPVVPSKVRPGLSACFDEICLKALAKSPNDRFASMSVFAERLTAALAESHKSRPRIARVPILVASMILLCMAGLWAIPTGRLWEMVSLKTRPDRLGTEKANKGAVPDRSSISIAKTEGKKPLFYRTPGFEPWLKEVVAMSPEKQVGAVTRKLVELNPKFDGKMQPGIDNNNEVNTLRILTDNVRDISPIRALVKLRYLWGSSNSYLVGAQGALEDISPLEGLQLWLLTIEYTQVADLTPLRGMKTLDSFECAGTNVADLSPIAGLPINTLNLRGTKVRDLTTLKGMKLVRLNLDGNLPIDLTPLRGMPLNYLDIWGAKVTDLSALKDMPLQFLYLGFDPDRDTELLQSIRTLEKINDKPVAEFWKEIAAQETAKKPLFFRTPGFEPWKKEVIAMTPEKQVEAVSRKLMELNPKFDGKLQPGIDNNAVTGLHVPTVNVTDISPVRALVKMYSLWCSCDDPSAHGALEDISPLEGLRLWALSVNNTRVADLSPLRGMMLTEFSCNSSNVADLSPLTGMPLDGLDLKLTKVTDLSPLKGMKLRTLLLDGIPKINLEALRGVPLTLLSMRDTKATGVSVLKTMPLKYLAMEFDPSRDKELLHSIKTLETINDKPAAEFWKEVAAHETAQKPLYFQSPDFGPWAREVAKMPAEEQAKAVAKKLVELNPKFDGTTRHTIQAGVVNGFDFFADDVGDISPVRALAGLNELWCSTTGPGAKHIAPEDLSPLRGLPLTFLAFNWTRVSNLEPLRGMKLTSLKCDSANVSDLSPLTDMPLTELQLAGNRITDLSPLKGMPLTHLNIDNNPVTDLSQLRGKPLILLSLKGINVSDLSLLKDMPLQFLCLDFKPDRDTELLHSLKTLELINIKPVAEFWKEVESPPAVRKP